jgi:putative ABC transport system substrate-binding protein
MDRRRFLLTSLAGALGVPVVAEAQPARGVRRVGYLAASQARFEAFRQGLRDLGWVAGQNILIEPRLAGAQIEHLPGLATELVRLNVHLIVAVATPAARAAQRATVTIPIVAIAMGDPVRDGLVASLARPGANLTGSTFLGPELVPKRLELLKDALPKASRIAVLWHPGAFSERTTKDMFRETEQAAKTRGVRLQFVEVRSPEELDDAFSKMAREHSDALMTFPSTMLFGERRRIVALAAKHRLPSMTNSSEFVEHGGLMAYGASLADLNRRAATYVDKILKGAKPGDLPIEQPTKFELVLNLKTAKALGLTIPPSLLARADEVIE